MKASNFWDFPWRTAFFISTGIATPERFEVGSLRRRVTSCLFGKLLHRRIAFKHLELLPNGCRETRSCFDENVERFLGKRGPEKHQETDCPKHTRVN